MLKMKCRKTIFNEICENIFLFEDKNFQGMYNV